MLFQSLLTIATATLAVASPLAAVKVPRSVVTERAGESCTGDGAHWMWIKPAGTLVAEGCASFEAACTTAAADASEVTNTCSRAYVEGTAFQTVYAYCVADGAELSSTVGGGLGWSVASCDDACTCTMG